MTKVMPRIETLYYFIYELAQCFHADEATLESIKTGILDNQIIDNMTLWYKNKSGKSVAKLLIKIDWKTHQMLAETDDGKNIEIDMSKSIVDNIVGWRKFAVAHVDAIMKQFDVCRVMSTYHYRSEICKTPADHQRAREIMHHIPSVASDLEEMIDSDLQSAISGVFTDATDSEMADSITRKRSFDCGKLSEVSVEMTYKAHN